LWRHTANTRTDWSVIGDEPQDVSAHGSDFHWVPLSTTMLSRLAGDGL